MIYKDCTITISKGVATISEPIILYRGDKEVELCFEIKENLYKYSDGTNIVSSSEASYSQIVIKVPNNKPPIFGEILETKEGKAVLKVTSEMIDEIDEVGFYDFQVRLFDKSKTSRITIPPVEKGIEIREPIATEDDSNKADIAMADRAITTAASALDAFDTNGNYNETTWSSGKLITSANLNKIEKGITGVNAKATNAINSIPTKTSQLTNDSDFATKEYVDAQSVKKLTSTNESPIVINDLADGIYDFGNSSFVKMFNSDTSVLTDNITGICVLYSVKGVNKRFLYVDYKLSTPTGVTYKYELNTSESTYKTHKYNSLLSLGGTSSSILVIKDEPLLVTGMYVTVCSGLKMLSTDDSTKTVSLGTGKKTLYMSSSTSGNLKTYHITIVNSYNGIIKAIFVYDTSTNTTVSVDKQEYTTKKYVDEQCKDIAKDVLLEDGKLYLKKVMELN